MDNVTVKDVQAWVNRMPGPDAQQTFHARVELEFNTTGYSAELVRHEPQDEGDSTLVLDLVINRPNPDDAVGDAITPDTAEYSEPTDTVYQNLILVSRTTIPVQVVE
jgi:hypothetical protein